MFQPLSLPARRPSRERPPLPVAGYQLNGRMRLCETERAVSPAGGARARCSAAPGAVRRMGVGGEDRIRSYGGWRGRAATWGSVSLRRASRVVRKRVGTAVLRPAGLLGRGRPSLWCVCVPTARAFSELWMTPILRTQPKHGGGGGSRELGEGSLCLRT